MTTLLKDALAKQLLTIEEKPSQAVIKDQLWQPKNLNTLNNGDIIFLTNAVEEWKEACENKIPACCYYKFEQTYENKLDKMYNLCY